MGARASDGSAYDDEALIVVVLVSRRQEKRQLIIISDIVCFTQLRPMQSSARSVLCESS